MICAKDRSRGPVLRRFALRVVPTVLLFGACSPPGTPDFLDAGDFEGSYDTPVTNNVYRGQTDYDGYLVFANLPRTIVDDVLPTDLQLAPNVSSTYQNVHPIILLYGDQSNGTYVFPPYIPPVTLGTSYHEVVMLIPFVRQVGGTKWHNYVVRMYLDNLPAVQIGNQYYGYFKELAVLTETSTTATLSQLEVNQGPQTNFQWTAETPSGSFVSSASATGTLDNYKHAIDIMRMPLLGTLTTLLLPTYVCSFWDWNLQNADVRPVEVTSQFVQPPRSGTTSWVGQGAIVSDEKFAFEIHGLVWQLAYPPVPCSF
jgi:hypothetical protein